MPLFLILSAIFEMSFIGTNPHHHMRITGGKDPGSIHNSTPSRAGNKMSEPVDDFSWKLV
jgi:hypothetical protein